MAEFTDPSRRLERLILSMRPKFARQFLAVVRAIQNDLSLDEITRLAQLGLIEEALVSAEAAMLRLSNLWGEVFIGSGSATAVFLANTLELVVNFDTSNGRALAAMQRNQLRLVRGFVEDQRVATRRALVDGIRRGINPRAMARTFRDSIGLTAKQIGFIQNYRRQLENLDAGALRRLLRDRRFDATIRRAIENQQFLSQSQIERMVGRYQQRWLKFRSETIARMEALRSVHEGNQEMYRQAIGNGQLDAREIIRTWDTVGDEKVRDPAHTAMQSQQRGIEEAFISGLGNFLMYPGDTSAPAEETAGCRCALATRFTDSAKIRAQGRVAELVA